MSTSSSIMMLFLAKVAKIFEKGCRAGLESGLNGLVLMLTWAQPQAFSR
jgi:hypothetical protein